MRMIAAASLAAALGLATALAAPSEPARTATGTIVRVQATQRSVVVAVSGGPEMAFVWNAETKIIGVLQPGARVTIRYAAEPDGKNLAQQITVARS